MSLAKAIGWFISILLYVRNGLTQNNDEEKGLKKSRGVAWTRRGMAA